MFFELVYRVLLIRAYRVGDLGLVYPLMRGLSPLVVLALTLTFAGEVLTGQQIIGILLIPCGMACLLWQGGGGDRLPWSMLPVVALIGLCIGCYTFLDGQAIRRWSHPLDYLVWVTLLSAWPFPLLAVTRKRAAFALFWRTQWRLGVAVGVCVLASYALVLWAMQLGSIAEAAALREVSVILVVLFGWFWCGDGERFRCFSGYIFTWSSVALRGSQAIKSIGSGFFIQIHKAPKSEHGFAIHQKNMIRTRKLHGFRQQNTEQAQSRFL